MGYEHERLLDSLTWARHFARACASNLPQHLDRDDLQSAGVLGYLRAAARFDATRGASFRGYCAVRIRGAVLDELRRWDWAPRSIHQSQRRITRITSNLTENLEREPTRDELAAALGIDVTELAAFQSQSQPRTLISFDEVAENSNGEEGLPLTERLADPSADRPDARVVSLEDRRTMVKCLAALPSAQATVIVLHYLKNVPLREVARKLKVTPARVSQLHHQALERLRTMWQRSHAVR
jgi:RNA polymerase sigma factor for flagellar operon FliA